MIARARPMIASTSRSTSRSIRVFWLLLMKVCKIPAAASTQGGEPCARIKAPTKLTQQLKKNDVVVSATAGRNRNTNRTNKEGYFTLSSRDGNAPKQAREEGETILSVIHPQEAGRHMISYFSRTRPRRRAKTPTPAATLLCSLLQNSAGR